MSADDLTMIPFADRTPQLVRSHYHREFPLLRAYEEVVAASGRDGIDQRIAAKAALERIGLPPVHPVQVDCAVAFVKQLRDEMSAQCPEPVRDLAEAVHVAEYPYAGDVLSAEDFADLSAESRAEHVATLAEDIWTAEGPERMRGLWAEALALALPAVYARLDSRETR